MTKPLRRRLTEASAVASRADRAWAAYMLAETGTLPFETAASLAAKVAVSEPTVGRFCRSLGYTGFKALTVHLRAELGDGPWRIGDRLRDLQARHRAGEDQPAGGLEPEMAVLVAVYETAQSDAWATVVKRLATVGTVFAAGFRTERASPRSLATSSSTCATACSFWTPRTAVSPPCWPATTPIARS